VARPLAGQCWIPFSASGSTCVMERWRPRGVGSSRATPNVTRRPLPPDGPPHGPGEGAKKARRFFFFFFPVRRARDPSPRGGVIEICACRGHSRPAADGGRLFSARRRLLKRRTAHEPRTFQSDQLAEIRARGTHRRRCARRLTSRSTRSGSRPRARDGRAADPPHRPRRRLSMRFHRSDPAVALARACALARHSRSTHRRDGPPRVPLAVRLLRRGSVFFCFARRALPARASFEE